MPRYLRNRSFGPVSVHPGAALDRSLVRTAARNAASMRRISATPQRPARWRDTRHYKTQDRLQCLKWKKGAWMPDPSSPPWPPSPHPLEDPDSPIRGIPSPSLPYSSIILSLASSLPLEVGPLNTARGSDAALQPGLEATPAEIEFGAF